jgi:hypothetical protein
MELILRNVKIQGTEYNSAFSHALNITRNVFTTMTPSSSVA